MQIVEGSQNPTQWSHPSHPGSLWSLAILCGPLWCFPGPLRSLAVFIVTQRQYIENSSGCRSRDDGGFIKSLQCEVLFRLSTFVFVFSLPLLKITFSQISASARLAILPTGHRYTFRYHRYGHDLLLVIIGYVAQDRRFTTRIIVLFYFTKI